MASRPRAAPEPTAIWLNEFNVPPRTDPEPNQKGLPLLAGERIRLYAPECGVILIIKSANGQRSQAREKIRVGER